MCLKNLVKLKQHHRHILLIIGKFRAQQHLTLENVQLQTLNIDKLPQFSTYSYPTTTLLCRIFCCFTSLFLTRSQSKFDSKALIRLSLTALPCVMEKTEKLEKSLKIRLV